jgi:hypothetical protein
MQVVVGTTVLVVPAMRIGSTGHANHYHYAEKNVDSMMDVTDDSDIYRAWVASLHYRQCSVLERRQAQNVPIEIREENLTLRYPLFLMHIAMNSST